MSALGIAAKAVKAISIYGTLLGAPGAALALLSKFSQLLDLGEDFVAEQEAFVATVQTAADEGRALTDDERAALKLESDALSERLQDAAKDA